MHISLFFHFFVVFHNNLFILQGIYLWHNERIFHGRTFFFNGNTQKRIEIQLEYILQEVGREKGVREPQDMANNSTKSF